MSRSQTYPTLINDRKDRVISLKEGDIAYVLNRTIVIHEKIDDFEGATGNAGGRLACGVIRGKL